MPTYSWDPHLVVSKTAQVASPEELEYAQSLLLEAEKEDKLDKWRLKQQKTELNRLQRSPQTAPFVKMAKERFPNPTPQNVSEVADELYGIYSQSGNAARMPFDQWVTLYTRNPNNPQINFQAAVANSSRRRRIKRASFDPQLNFVEKKAFWDEYKHYLNKFYNPRSQAWQEPAHDNTEAALKWLGRGAVGVGAGAGVAAGGLAAAPALAGVTGSAGLAALGKAGATSAPHLLRAGASRLPQLGASAVKGVTSGGATQGGGLLSRVPVLGKAFGHSNPWVSGGSRMLGYMGADAALGGVSQLSEGLADDTLGERSANAQNVDNSIQGVQNVADTAALPMFFMPGVSKFALPFALANSASKSLNPWVSRAASPLGPLMGGVNEGVGDLGDAIYNTSQDNAGRFHTATQSLMPNAYQRSQQKMFDDYHSQIEPLWQGIQNRRSYTNRPYDNAMFTSY